MRNPVPGFGSKNNRFAGRREGLGHGLGMDLPLGSVFHGDDGSTTTSLRYLYFRQIIVIPYAMFYDPVGL